MKIDQEFKNLIPPLTAEEYAQLEQNCLDYGIRDSLVITSLPGESDTVLIDGHNRFEIAQKNNLSYNVRRLDFKDRDAIKEWIIKNQLGRRNIPAYVRAELALKLKPVIAEKAKENQKAAGGAVPQKSAKAVDTREELAKAAGVSHDTIHKVEKIQQKAPEAIKEKLRTGEMSINQVYGWIAKEEHPNRYQQAAKDLRDAKKRNEEFEEQKADGVVDLADAKQNKDDREKIFESFLNSFNDMHSQIRHFKLMADNDDFGKTLSYGDKYAIRDILAKLGNDLRTIMRLQRIAVEVNDEK